jgi:hypothetical protein
MLKWDAHELRCPVEVTCLVSHYGEINLMVVSRISLILMRYKWRTTNHQYYLHLFFWYYSSHHKLPNLSRSPFNQNITSCCITEKQAHTIKWKSKHCLIQSKFESQMMNLGQNLLSSNYKRGLCLHKPGLGFRTKLAEY